MVLNRSYTGLTMPVMADNKFVRLFMIFILYVAQGAPIGFFHFAIPAWMTASGLGALEVGGYLAMTVLPWSLKFINGFLMDRYTYLAMGRRRIWLIGAQTGMVLGCLALAAANPAVEAVAVLSAFSFIINCFTTFQDVAIDGMAVDLLEDDERAYGNGLMFGGQSLGIALGTAIPGTLTVLAGFETAAVTVGGFIGLVMILILFTRERAGEKAMPWSKGVPSPDAKAVQLHSFREIIGTTVRSMVRWPSITYVVMSFLAGTGYGFYLGGLPLMATEKLGWATDMFSQASGTSNLVAALCGIVLFGAIINRLGVLRSIAVAYVFMASLGLVAILMFDVVMGGSLFFALMISIYAADVFQRVATCALAMRLCAISVAATQFTLYMAVANLGTTVASGLIGPLSGFGGTPAIFGAMIGTNMLGLGFAALHLLAHRRAVTAMTA